MTFAGNLLVRGQPSSGDPYANQVVLFLKGEGANGTTNIVDEKGTSITVINSVTHSTSQFKLDSSSLLYPSNNANGVAMPDSTANHLRIEQGLLTGIDTFTVEAWIYLTTDTTDNCFFTSSYDFRLNYCFTVRIASGKLEANYIYNNAATGTITAATTLSTNTWYHVAVTRSGSSHSLWLDGSLDGSGTNATTITNTTGQSVVGARVTTFSSNPSVKNQYGGFRGHIDNLRVTSGVARYTATFDPNSIVY